jgi:hypothetical protein
LSFTGIRRQAIGPGGQRVADRVALHEPLPEFVWTGVCFARRRWAGAKQRRRRCYERLTAEEGRHLPI